MFNEIIDSLYLLLSAGVYIAIVVVVVGLAKFIGHMVNRKTGD